ncbi:hypothetical protein HYPSUDRAFT_826281 [Hypholoma sublateritium FD-334 SS-4]|uniref:Uncharacterized protein n=1 Tax=Hypholoma sublateritium (strain FD-334 SS-4) TaxID=945553 RepID=A0A0D2NUQ9_HYPSF|nr:hypothetical protein HYPSUDRAFT_826281 [Hypholoma sublateritium FD-334 SS-4]
MHATPLLWCLDSARASRPTVCVRGARRPAVPARAHAPRTSFSCHSVQTRAGLRGARSVLRTQRTAAASPPRAHHASLQRFVRAVPQGFFDCVSLSLDAAGVSRASSGSDVGRQQ